MNWKLIVAGGLVWYVVTFAVSLVTGPFVHNGILADDYIATAAFWRPELMETPPDMAALMPRWVATGIVAAFITAFMYGWVRPALSGPGWLRGVKFGLIVVLMSACFMLNWSGVFGLPDVIWAWWCAESVVYCLIAGAALGWVADKVAPMRRQF